jgi:hypothetical protein
MATSSAFPDKPSFSWPRIFIVLIGLVVVLYAGDFAWYQMRLHTNPGSATGSVHRIRLLAISNKGDKTTYELDQVHPEEDVPCSHSLFPQGGSRPCWYVTRHANDPIPM